MHDAVNTLKGDERFIVVKSYMEEEPESDLDIWLELGEGKTKYYKIKGSALLRLALNLKIEVLYMRKNASWSEDKMRFFCIAEVLLVFIGYEDMIYNMTRKVSYYISDSESHTKLSQKHRTVTVIIPFYTFNEYIPQRIRYSCCRVDLSIKIFFTIFFQV
ncbi:phage transcriptional regulator, ArpU family protein [Bacillus clarus]|uniref:Phage transcriptional regulator, ArpU family protein n=1 Tax=Bacillus clarus TaxID=2338372 RepID=A0A090ZGD2_9BACI|nr:phage transcriptional regulator, ArpU family protein [Bacillus clarus]